MKGENGPKIKMLQIFQCSSFASTTLQRFVHRNPFIILWYHILRTWKREVLRVVQKKRIPGHL